MNAIQWFGITATTLFPSNCSQWILRAVACFALCLAICLPGEGSEGPTTCIPPAVGVPGFSNPRPNWFDNTQPSPDFQPDWDVLIKQFHDPRWRGAVSHDFGASTSESEFRGLFNKEGNTTYLYLSWYVKFAPNIDAAHTSLFVGFMPTAGATAGTILQFTVNSAGDTQDNAANYATTVWTGNGSSTGWSTIANPTWATKDTRVWVKGSSAPNQWAFELRIPIDPNGNNGVNLGTGDFLMWHEMQITTPPFQCQGGVNHGQSCNADTDCPGSTCGTTNLIFYTWPRIDPNNPVPYLYQQVPSGPNLVNTFPSLDHWGDFKLSNNPSSDASCKNGIYLADDQIGTAQQGLWGSELSLSATNHFFAKPNNFSSTAVSPNVITADFFLANWGSQGIGTLLPGKCQGGVNNGNSCTTNTDCPGATCVGASWMPIPPGTNVPDPNGIAGLGQGNIPVDWTLGHDDKCTFTGRNGTHDYRGNLVPGDPTCPNADPLRDLDTCLMVKLNGPGLDFNRDSAWTNIEVVAASNFTREAEVRAIPGVHKAYLYVETWNMPSVIDQLWKAAIDKLFGPPKQRTEATMRETVARMSSVERKQNLPTYIVHVYYDTGKTVSLGGVNHPILLPQVSFGYYVVPHTDVFGWTNNLEGATQIAPNAYQLPLPNGIARVRTTIVGVDKHCTKLPGFGGGAVFVLGGVFLIGLAVHRPRRKKKNTPETPQSQQAE